MHRYLITMSWTTSQYGEERMSKPVCGINPDAAIASARYIWLAAMTARGLPEAEASYEQNVKVECLRPLRQEELL